MLWSVVSNSFAPLPWDFPSKNTGVGCHFFLQGILPTQGPNPSLLHLLHWQMDSGCGYLSHNPWKRDLSGNPTPPFQWPQGIPVASGRQP